MRALPLNKVHWPDLAAAVKQSKGTAVEACCTMHLRGRLVAARMHYLLAHPLRAERKTARGLRLRVIVRRCWLCTPECGNVAACGCAAIPLSEDHKPNRTDERSRIEAAGGVVVWAGTWRVGGVLAVSRAFGDRLLKRYVVRACVFSRCIPRGLGARVRPRLPPARRDAARPLHAPRMP